MKQQASFLFSCCMALLSCQGLHAADSKTEPDTVVVTIKGKAPRTVTAKSVPAQVYRDSCSGRAEASEIILNVHEDGSVTINGERFKDKDRLYAYLRERAIQDQDQTIRIRGEAKTEYQKMVDVLDACTKAGFWNVSFSTRKAVPAPVLVTLELLRDGSVLVDGERSASREELVGKLKALHEENSHASFRITSAPDVRHAHMMTLMEDLIKAGIKSVQLPKFDEPS